MITALTTAPALRLNDCETEVITKPDGLDYVSGGLFSQGEDEGVIPHVSYVAKMLPSAVIS
jgi:hypothetical protein